MGYQATIVCYYDGGTDSRTGTQNYNIAESNVHIFAENDDDAQKQAAEVVRKENEKIKNEKNVFKRWRMPRRVGLKKVFYVSQREVK